MKNKKGFTLIELLAVMIVLIIIILIAYNIIKKNVDDAIDNTTRANAATYIKAVNSLVSEKSVVDETYETGYFTVSTLDELGLKISGTKPDDGYVLVANSEITYSCLEYEGYYIKYENGKVGNPIKGACGEVDTEYTFDYTGEVETLDIIISSDYLIEAWGAQGATSGGTGGKGGYSKGTIHLNTGDKLYIAVGGAGSVTTGGFNGGGDGSVTCYTGSDYKSGGGGGGATSIAINNNLGELKNYNAQRSSILIVAGGGGGGAYISGNYNGGAGGGETGGNGSGRSITTQGATQSSGFSFGQGQTGGPCGGSWGESGRGGGGGGFYGGAASQTAGNGIAGGAGGSGFVNSLLTNAEMQSGVREGNGFVQITAINSD